MAEDAPLNPPKQARSKRTLERIVRASLDILESEGPEGLTVQAIVDRADSSVGSFYARFDGKGDLLDYLGDRLWTEATERWNRALAARDWTDRSLPELVEGAVALLGDAGRSRGAYLEALGRAGASDDAYERFRAHVLEGLVEVLLSRREDIVHPDPDLAVRLGLVAVSAVLRGSGGPPMSGVTAQRVEEEARRLLRGYLQPGDADVPTGGVEFFDIWG